MSRIEDALAKANETRLKDKNGTLAGRSSPAMPHRSNRYLVPCLSIGLVVILSAALYLFFIAKGDAGGPSKIGVKVEVPMQNQAPKKGLSLPLCIPLGSQDSSYSSTHPGWRRYETDLFEYRVFFEARDVKAIQVMAKEGKHIPDDFFVSFVNEIDPRNGFILKSTAEKGGCIVENGMVGDVAEILRYRNKTDGTVSAFVVAAL